jgi:hypothetical protein
MQRVFVFALLFFFVLCTLCCQFLWFVPFWLPLRYSLTFINLQFEYNFHKNDTYLNLVNKSEVNFIGNKTFTSMRNIILFTPVKFWMELPLLRALKENNYYKYMQKRLMLESSQKCANGVLFYSLFMNTSVCWVF